MLRVRKLLINHLRLNLLCDNNLTLSPLCHPIFLPHFPTLLSHTLCLSTFFHFVLLNTLCSAHSRVLSSFALYFLYTLAFYFLSLPTLMPSPHHFLPSLLLQFFLLISLIFSPFFLSTFTPLSSFTSSLHFS